MNIPKWLLLCASVSIINQVSTNYTIIEFSKRDSGSAFCMVKLIIEDVPVYMSRHLDTTLLHAWIIVELG